MSGFGVPGRNPAIAPAGFLRRGFSPIGGGGQEESVFEQYGLTVYADYDPATGVYQDSGGETEVASDGDPAGLVRDQSGNGHDISQATGSARPAWHSNQANGKPTIRHASGDVLKAALAADWKFLHDGSKEYAVYVVWKVPDINAPMVIVDSGGASAADTGFSIYLRAGNDVNAKIAKGASGNFEAECVTTDSGVADEKFHVTAARLTDSQLELRNDGHWGGEADDTPDGSPSASDPTSALTVGGRYNNSLNLIGDWARLVVVEGPVSDEAHQAVQDHLAEVYGNPAHRYFDAPTVVQHDESGLDHNAFPGICFASNGDLVLAYRKGTTHSSNNDGVIAVKRSADGGASWGGESIILTDSSWDYRSASLTTLANGTIMMAVGRRTNNGTDVVNGLTVITSADNGVTWSSEVVVSTGYTGWVREGGAILELQNGDLLYPFYGVTSGSSSVRSAVARSQDGGATWAFLSEITISVYTPVEPGIVQLQNGDVVNLVRWTSVDLISTSKSSDNGQTWGTITWPVEADGRCNPFVLASGQIIDIQRQREISAEPAQLMYSPDNGDSWQLGHIFPGSPNFVNGEMVYAQCAQAPDGTIYVLYGTEATPSGSSSSVSDLMLSKSVVP